MDEVKITEYLRERYTPEAIILHGSRARGLNRPNSDWDLYVFTKNPSDDQKHHDLDENSLDVHVVNLPFNRAEFFDYAAVNLFDAKVLLDKDNLAKDLIEEANRIYAKGRNLTPEEYQNRKGYMKRTLDRMEQTPDDSGRFFLYLGYFYEKALQYWFDTKNRWGQPIYKALPIIQKEDPEYFKLLESLYSLESSNSKKVKTAKEIYNRLFGGK